MVKGDEVLPLLYKALLDRSVSVRRTAGDCLSDVGDPAAMFVMIKSLKDPSKLVRWRALCSYLNLEMKVRFQH